MGRARRPHRESGPDLAGTLMATLLHYRQEFVCSLESAGSRTQSDGVHMGSRDAKPSPTQQLHWPGVELRRLVKGDHEITTRQVAKRTDLNDVGGSC